MKMCKKIFQNNGKYLKIQNSKNLNWPYYPNGNDNIAISFLMLKMNKNSVNVILVYLKLNKTLCITHLFLLQFLIGKSRRYCLLKTSLYFSKIKHYCPKEISSYFSKIKHCTLLILIKT